MPKKEEVFRFLREGLRAGGIGVEAFTTRRRFRSCPVELLFIRPNLALGAFIGDLEILWIIFTNTLGLFWRFSGFLSQQLLTGMMPVRPKYGSTSHIERIELE